MVRIGSLIERPRITGPERGVARTCDTRNRIGPCGNWGRPQVGRDRAYVKRIRHPDGWPRAVHHRPSGIPLALLYMFWWTELERPRPVRDPRYTPPLPY
jgi:hypothetical protein